MKHQEMYLQCVRKAMVCTVGRWAKRTLLPALTNGAIRAMVTAKVYTKMNGIKNYTNYFRYNTRHANIFPEFKLLQFLRLVYAILFIFNNVMFNVLIYS